MAGHRVGGDVDAYCTRCRMILGHTIIAMVGDKIARVRCNTCQGQHAFKAGPPGTKTASSSSRASSGEGRTRPAAARAPREKAEVRPFEEVFAGRDAAAEARPYSPKERFAEAEIIAHPTFGMGLVRAARQDKIDVIFKLGEKTLVHGLAGGVRPPVSFTKPVRGESRSTTTADKPPPGEATGLHAVHAEPPTELPESSPGDEG